jgi:hypothetical protein
MTPLTTAPWDEPSEASPKHPPLPIGRRSAKAAGLKEFTGMFCRFQAHGNLRRVSDGKCCRCVEAEKAKKAKPSPTAARRAAQAKAGAEAKQVAADARKAERRAATEARRKERIKAKAAETRAAKKAGIVDQISDDSPPWE